jgi:antibiotic biosynthesis monooxygenase (ABM) superfamily enzyme
MTISASHRPFNQLVEFAVAPHHQADMVAALIDQAERFTCTYPGFLGATVQASEDGCRVLNYVQWQDRQACLDAVANAEQGEQDMHGLIRRYRATSVTFGGFEVMGRIEPNR